VLQQETTVELSGHPLWTIIAIVGAMLAIGLQLQMFRHGSARIKWLAMIPLVIAAAAGGGLADRLGDLRPWSAPERQCADLLHQRSP
jgi:hypothetical protein